MIRNTINSIIFFISFLVSAKVTYSQQNGANPSLQVHVAPYGNSCNGNQSGSEVKLYWGGSLQYEHSTGLDGLVSATCPPGSQVNGTATYG